MKGWYAQHSGSWHKIKDVTDSKKPVHEGGGNMYTLEGVDKPVHQDDIEDIASPEELGKADKIPGGLADKKKESDFDPKKLKAGIKVEMEHTSDPDIAKEIAMDHLTEDSNYYEKLKTVEKYDRVEITADGHIERDYGVEPLDKKPNNLKSKWSSIKKALDAKSFISINEELPLEEEDEEDQEDDSGADVPQSAAEMGFDSSESPEADAQGEERAESDRSSVPGVRQNIEDEDNQDESATMDQSSAPYSQQDQEQAAAGQEEAGPNEEPEPDSAGRPQGQQEGSVDLGESSPEEALQALEDHLREEGYSDHEIAYIIHGHAPHMLSSDEINSDKDAKLAQMDIDHKSRMKDVEHKKAMFDMETNSLDREHKKRVLDLEFDFLKQEKQLELEHKKKELELKLEQQKQKMEQSKSGSSSQSVSRDAAKTSQKERRGNG